MPVTLQNFGVIGGGAWGTALASALLRAGRDVTLWARERAVVEGINQRHENSAFLPGVALDPKLKATENLADIANCDAWVLVTPTQYTRAICQDIMSAGNGEPKPVIIASKGIEQASLSLPSALVNDAMPSYPVAILSGPTFAAEVANRQPTALTLACADQKLGRLLTQAVGSLTFRPYLSDDIIGAQIGGAVKNVLAVACGIGAGCGMGDNARAALITRGLAEMMRLGMALGGKAETLMGLSGMGDLVLTCSSPQSRNMSLGMALGRGEKLSDILASRSTVAEGVYTASAAHKLAIKLGVDMPIVAATDDVLNNGADVGATISALLSRPLRLERN